MTPLISIRPASKYRTIWSLLSAAIFLVCLYFGIFRMNRDSSLYPDGLFVMILASQNLYSLLYLWFDMNAPRWLQPIAHFSLLALLFAGTSQARLLYRSIELKKNGQVVDGKVEHLYEATGFPDYRDQEARVVYLFNNKRYAKNTSNKNLHFIKDDQIKVRISARNPEIMEVVGLTP